jgi:hypothetical protein
MNQQPQQLMFLPMPVSQQQRGCDNEVPARVRVALAFLDSLTMKTLTRCYSNDVSHNEVQGQELLPVERQSQAAALNMLTSYFNGKLAPSKWEELEILENEQSQLIHCPACNATGKNRYATNCPTCEGRGFLVVSKQRQK